jgi:hypothetical protein
MGMYVYGHALRTVGACMLVLPGAAGELIA